MISSCERSPTSSEPLRPVSSRTHRCHRDLRPPFSDLRPALDCRAQQDVGQDDGHDPLPPVGAPPPVLWASLGSTPRGGRGATGAHQPRLHGRRVVAVLVRPAPCRCAFSVRVAGRGAPARHDRRGELFRRRLRRAGRERHRRCSRPAWLWRIDGHDIGDRRRSAHRRAGRSPCRPRAGPAPHRGRRTLDGGCLALRWAAGHPDRVRSVVTFGAPLYLNRTEADEHIAGMGPMQALFAGDGPLPRVGLLLNVPPSNGRLLDRCCLQPRPPRARRPVRRAAHLGNLFPAH